MVKIKKRLRAVSALRCLPGQENPSKKVAAWKPNRNGKAAKWNRVSQPQTDA